MPEHRPYPLERLANNLPRWALTATAYALLTCQQVRRDIPHWRLVGRRVRTEWDNTR